jgi:aminoglycoside 6'-N-acetyltransferase
VSGVRLKPFDHARDLPLLAAWLTQQHVSRWWGDPVETLETLRHAPAATQALIEFRGRAVGFVCWQTPSRQELRDAGLGDLPSDLVDIDLMIGDPVALGLGVGPAALHQLLRRLRRGGISLAGLATAAGNSRAARAFVKAGFRPYRDFQEAGETYRYFVREGGAAV